MKDGHIWKLISEKQFELTDLTHQIRYVWDTTPLETRIAILRAEIAELEGKLETA